LGLSENKNYLLRAGILTDGEKARESGQLLSVLTRARRISEVIRNEPATKPSVKRPSGKGKGHFSATPELHVLDYQRFQARLARESTPTPPLFIMHKGA
jgi:hypothetical protein